MGGSTNTRLGYVPALDGLRGIAVALVVAYHAWGYPLVGWVGVHIFFVLSGFLITGLLLEEERPRLRTFYARRARRLLPALAAMLAVYAVIGGVANVVRWGFYTGNVYEAFWPGASTHVVGLNHLWSLAQEEQFYLVWPAALLVVRKARRPARILVAIACSLIAYRAALAFTGASNARIYFAPDMNVDGLLLGAALAFRRIATPRWAVGCAFFLLFMINALVSSVAHTDAVAVPLAELSALVLIAAAANGTLHLPRPLVWLGGISYSLYLWHFVVLWALHRQHPLAAVAVGVALACASTRWIEEPFRRRRQPGRTRGVGTWLRKTSPTAGDAPMTAPRWSGRTLVKTPSAAVVEALAGRNAAQERPGSFDRGANRPWPFAVPPT